MTGTTFLYGRHVHANGIRQHVLRYGGHGPALLLVPGITSPAVTWGFVAERLGRHFDTWVLDVRGRGLSESGEHLDYGLDACADDVLALIRAQDLHQVILVGHSMGGRHGIRAVKRGGADSRIAHLIMVDPPVSGPGRRAYPSAWPWYEDSIRECQQGIDAERMRHYCATWSEEQLRLRAEWLHTCDLRAIRTSYDGFHQDDVHADLPALTGIRTGLMVAGRGDVILPEDEAELREQLPDLRISRAPDAGHMIPWDDLEGFFRALSELLDQPL
ncbi:MAG: alpha/beta hydrolase [Alcanivorax sp.]|uniref:alpha/beta fold hydrolase n=1 Tax=Alloalcanivorax marinus TaxID=1177169 RepID=UPI001959FB09|nr:alpha/beta hydrolase [Alloalcanivorax marinus]MBM7334595.1 alpha/beta hydrolase [Alloalcanivorax marinus]